VKVKGRSAVGHATDITGHLGGIGLEIVEGLLAETAKLKDKAESRITIIEIICSLLIMIRIATQESA